MEFKGRGRPVPASIVSLLVVPNYVAFVPMLKIYSNIGLGGTFPAVWLAHIGFGMSLAIYILRNYMATLPKIDDRVGQDRRRQPLPDLLPAGAADVGPAVASFAIFQFLWVWNDLHGRADLPRSRGRTSR